MPKIDPADRLLAYAIIAKLEEMPGVVMARFTRDDQYSKTIVWHPLVHKIRGVLEHPNGGDTKLRYRIEVAKLAIEGIPDARWYLERAPTKKGAGGVSSGAPIAPGENHQPQVNHDRTAT